MDVRKIPLDAFFLGYRRSALQQGEVIASIEVPLPKAGEVFRAYKVSKRYDQDISTVCGAFWADMDGSQIQAIRMAYGGMAATPQRCEEAEKILRGTVLDEDILKQARSAIKAQFTPMSDMRGSARYRSLVAENLLQRFAYDLEGKHIGIMDL